VRERDHEGDLRRGQEQQEGGQDELDGPRDAFADLELDAHEDGAQPAEQQGEQRVGRPRRQPGRHGHGDGDERQRHDALGEQLAALRAPARTLARLLDAARLVRASRLLEVVVAHARGGRAAARAA
jgi:hypothetical protein